MKLPYAQIKIKIYIILMQQLICLGSVNPDKLYIKNVELYYRFKETDMQDNTAVLFHFCQTDFDSSNFKSVGIIPNNSKQVNTMDLKQY